MPHALIVDDDKDAAEMMAALVATEAFSVATAQTLRDARRQIALQPPDVILLDLKLPDGNGMALFDEPELIGQSQIVLITGHASLESSIQALRLGAADYLVKPVSTAHLRRILANATRPAIPQTEVDSLNAELDRSGHFGALWGRAPAMQDIYRQISRVAVTSVSVLISGESGTGKEVVARCLHDLSRRRNAPFLAINCGAISPNLMESEIFGHERGSFTGADRQHLGFFERANGGTLFLDEVTEMPQELQVKLLRVLETGTFMRVGSTQLLETDVRVVAATNRPPQQAVDAGKLREDLYYRLNVFPIVVPPLRDRLEDIELLAGHFLADINEKEGHTKHFAPGTLAALHRYAWPGNVRELRNVVQRLYVMATGELITEAWVPTEDRPVESSAEGASLAPDDDPSAEPSRAALGGEPAPRSITIPLGISMAEAEARLIHATLRYFNNHKERTAAALGVSLKTLYNRLKEYSRESAD